MAKDIIFDSERYEKQQTVKRYLIPAAVLVGLIVVAAVVTVAVYAAYTLADDTVARFGTRWLAATVPFVAAGVGRYLALVYGRGDTGRPEKILLTDRILWCILAGYGLAALGAVIAVKI